MGSLFSKSEETSSTNKKRKKDPYVDMRRSYKKPKRKMTKHRITRVLANERVVSFSDRSGYDVFSLGLTCKAAYRSVSQMEMYWYQASVAVGLGDWNWFFTSSNHNKKVPGMKSWIQVHSFLRSSKVKFVSDDLKAAFPETLKFGKKETWTKCKLNRNHLDSLFSDFVTLFQGFNEGRCDNQCDIYPIGMEAYIRSPAKDLKQDIVSEKEGKDLMNDMKCLTKHLGVWLYDPLEYPTIDNESTYETMTMSGQSLKEFLENPDVNFVHIRSDARENSHRSIRILFSKMFSYVLQVHFPNVVRTQYMTSLKILHVAIENAFKLIKDADYAPEETNGVRPDTYDDLDVMYTSDLIKPLQDALCQVLSTKKKNTITVDMFPIFPSSSRQYSVDHYLDLIYPRLKRSASTYLKRLNQSLKKKKNDDDNETTWLLLSDSDRMPIGPQSNDHNGIVYLALLTRRFAWVLMGKSDSC
jgi:hypothetical protein